MTQLQLQLFPRLAPKEQEMIGLMTMGHISTKELSDKLNIKEGTVKIKLHNIYVKLGFNTNKMSRGSKKVKLLNLFATDRIPLPFLDKSIYEIAKFTLLGYSNKDIADLLNLPTTTVKQRIGLVYDKLGVWSREELVSRYYVI